MTTTEHNGPNPTQVETKRPGYVKDPVIARSIEEVRHAIHLQPSPWRLSMLPPDIGECTEAAIARARQLGEDGWVDHIPGYGAFLRFEAAVRRFDINAASAIAQELVRLSDNQCIHEHIDKCLNTLARKSAVRMMELSETDPLECVAFARACGLALPRIASSLLGQDVYGQHEVVLERGINLLGQYITKGIPGAHLEECASKPDAAKFLRESEQSYRRRLEEHFWELVIGGRQERACIHAELSGRPDLVHIMEEQGLTFTRLVETGNPAIAVRYAGSQDPQRTDLINTLYFNQQCDFVAALQVKPWVAGFLSWGRNEKSGTLEGLQSALEAWRKVQAEGRKILQANDANQEAGVYELLVDGSQTADTHVAFSIERRVEQLESLKNQALSDYFIHPDMLKQAIKAAIRLQNEELLALVELHLKDLGKSVVEGYIDGMISHRTISDMQVMIDKGRASRVSSVTERYDDLVGRAVEYARACYPETLTDRNSRRAKVQGLIDQGTIDLSLSGTRQACARYIYTGNEVYLSHFLKN